MEARLFGVLLPAALAEPFLGALVEARLFGVLAFAALAERFSGVLVEARLFGVLLPAALAEPFLGALVEARLFGVLLVAALAEARLFEVRFFAALVEARLFSAGVFAARAEARLLSAGREARPFVALFFAAAEARLFGVVFFEAPLVRVFPGLAAARLIAGRVGSVFVAISVLPRVFPALVAARRFVELAARALVAFEMLVPATIAAWVFDRAGAPVRDAAGFVPASRVLVSRFVLGGFVSVRIPSCSDAAPRFPFDASAGSAPFAPAMRRFFRRSAKRNPFTALTMLPAAPRAPFLLVVRPFFFVLGARSSSAAGTKPIPSSPSGIVLRRSSRPSMLCLV